MAATAIAAVVNLVGDVALCQGFGLGVRGAAAATTGAQHTVNATAEPRMPVASLSRLLLCGHGCGVHAAANWIVFAVMLRWLRQPLPGKSPYRGISVGVKAVVPKMRAAMSFLALAGPVLGVITVKVLFFVTISAAAADISSSVAGAHQILFCVPPLLSRGPCLCLHEKPQVDRNGVCDSTALCSTATYRRKHVCSAGHALGFLWRHHWLRGTGLPSS